MAIAIGRAGCPADDLVAQISGCPRACWDVADYGSCPSTPDSACLCNEPAFVESIATCVETTCTTEEIEDYQQIADQICATANVVLIRRFATNGVDGEM
ncbi:hypothetical protein DAEQUDRAFT_733974 [Daedalea quercina L-15889]|uniref:CFEM domain-containing protein n=1 Tax=Daedalea quercina L-15889 TaxID=1314783 RepID=A0A165KM80_9APHY|nr:hypothetical protein DAEQUDRAFT_733974 [Daedalea quercina L-15889]